MKFPAPVFLVLTLSSLTMAQIPHIEVFGGFSTERIAPCGATASNSFGESCGFEQGELQSSLHYYNGWNAAVTLHERLIGFTADIAGHYGTYNGAPSLSRYSFLFGPTVRIPVPKITPFAHALFGVVKEISSGDSALAFTEPGIALGGGVDWKMSKLVAIRLAQVDYEWQRNPTGGLPGPHGFRLGSGVVLRF
jgi:hypothetical protein